MVDINMDIECKKHYDCRQCPYFTDCAGDFDSKDIIEEELI